MPTADSTVGILDLPVAPGAPQSPIDDPTIVGLLDYLGFWIKWALDGKFAALRSTTLGAVPLAIADACPVANRFPWSPLDPSNTFVRGKGTGAKPETQRFPAVWMWWEGRSTRKPWSILLDMRERTLNVLYVFPRITIPAALVDRAGLMGAVDAVLADACANGAHPQYGYNGAPLGTQIAVSLGLAGFGLYYAGGQAKMMGAVPATPQGADQPSVLAYPTLRASFLVQEGVSSPSVSLPGDLAPDVESTMGVNELGDTDDALQILHFFDASPAGAAVEPDTGTGSAGDQQG